jgi:hypothetical protein
VLVVEDEPVVFVCTVDSEGTAAVAATEIGDGGRVVEAAWPAPPVLAHAVSSTSKAGSTTRAVCRLDTDGSTTDLERTAAVSDVEVTSTVLRPGRRVCARPRRRQLRAGITAIR